MRTGAVSVLEPPCLHGCGPHLASLLAEAQTRETRF